MLEGITASEVAGFGVGAMLLAATLAAPKVDAFISASQRSSLGMCKKCGDLRLIACSQCKGVGLIRERSPLDFIISDDLGEPFTDRDTPIKSKPCPKCEAKGRFKCPACSKSFR